MKPLRNLIFISTILLGAITPADAQFMWDHSGVPAREDYRLNWSGSAVRNGAGDTYVAWHDSRNDIPSVYCQKYDAQGQSLWSADVEVVHSPAVQMVTRPTSDNGLVVAWGTYSPGSPSLIYAQKIDADGNLLWPAGGILIGQYIFGPGEDGSYSLFDLVADLSGGVFVLWNSDVPSSSLLAKHLLADGSLAPGWDIHGTLIKSEAYSLQQGQSCADGEGGFIVAWRQNNLPRHQFLYAQRFDGSANRMWGDHGLQLCSSCTYAPAVTPDNAGGAFFAWPDRRTSDVDLFMQRVDHDGNVLWTANGLPLLQFPSLQNEVQLVPDGSGGFLAAWDDHRFEQSYEYGYYYQRVNGSGVLQWTPSGYQLNVDEGYTWDLQITPDGVGGLFASWSRSTYYAPNYWQDSYAQHVLATGMLAWQSPGGLLLRGGSYKEIYSTIPVNVGSGQALFYWHEIRDNHIGIYEQKINAAGQMQFPPTGQTVVEALAGDWEYVRLTAMSSDRFLSVWADDRYSFQPGKLVYYQIHDNLGNALLPTEGIPICFQTQFQQDFPEVTATSDGGAVISWAVGEWTDVKTQKINSQGVALWDPAGIPITVGPNLYPNDQRLCSDGAGGVYIAFRGGDMSLNLQHLDANGNRLLGNTGAPLTPFTTSWSDYLLLPDGAGGAIVVGQININDDWPILASRILPSGVIAWTDTVYYASDDPYYPIAIPTQNGGAIVAWEDMRNGDLADIYAQKFDNSGNMLWAQNGVPVITGPENDEHANIVEDDEGYLYFGCLKNDDIFCQRLNPQGERMFLSQGIPVGLSPEAQSGPRLVADTQGGAIFTWDTDARYSNGPVYATHLNASGEIAHPAWAVNGNPIAPFPGSQYVRSIVADGSGGAVISLDHSDRGLYLQRVNDSQITGLEPLEFTAPNAISLTKLSPNPFNATTVLSYELRVASHVTLKVYDTAGRLVVALADGWREAGTHEVTFNGSNLASGIYLNTLTTGQNSITGKMVLLK
jgi:hypothetical protein